MGETNPIRILFIADESSHVTIFQKVIAELSKMSPVWFKILDSNRLFDRPLSIRFYFKHELQYFTKIVEDAKPDILIVANDQGIKTALIRICKLKKIPSIVIQDGILINNKQKKFSSFLVWRRYLLWRIFSSFTDIPVISQLSINAGRQWCIPSWGTGNATIIAAMGNYYKRVLVSRGIHPDKIAVTGYPLLDDFSKSSLNNCSLDSLKIVEDTKPIILLITQPLVEDGLWDPSLRTLHLDSIVSAVKHVDGKLIVKVHPRENMEIYQLLAKKYGDIFVTVIKDFNVNQLILLSDAVVTVSSTVGLWAMAYHKPLLVTNYFPQGDTENVLENMAISVNKSEDFPTILDQVLSDKNLKSKILTKQSSNIHDHLFYLDGCASRRIANLILNLVKNKQHTHNSSNYKMMKKHGSRDRVTTHK